MSSHTPLTALHNGREVNVRDHLPGTGSLTKSSPAQLKADIEETIKRLVTAQIQIFKDETGLDVSSVMLNFNTTFTIGKHSAPFLASARIYI